MTNRRYNLPLHLLVLAALAGSIFALAQAAFSTAEGWGCTAQLMPSAQAGHSTGFEAAARDGAARGRH
jgi:hypothetical protein